MRLWSLHPKYLDRQGLLAVWREGLLAVAVLSGKTTGYRHHPQLQRFRSHNCPVSAINSYMCEVYLEAVARGYRFDGSKIHLHGAVVEVIPVTLGQLQFEQEHLMGKLAIRAPERLNGLAEPPLATHPLFVVVPGDIEDWEKVN
ncbi:MAG TPA: pyrimidine dimer DNA glycosylase/endonuclease V [Bacillota bacterium]|nr:pyrimidine dimer DNA glycosylase/endonuclease V [Bacillota bacterium]